MSVLYPVDACTKLHAPANGRVSEHVPLYGHTAEVRCNDGYTFPNNGDVIYLECLKGGMWNVTLTNGKLHDCQGAVVVVVVA